MPTKPPSGNLTVTEMYDQVVTALKMFGEYPFRDKGPREVMDIDALAERIHSLDAVEAGKLLRGLAHSGPTEAFRRSFSAYAAGEIVLDLQEWDELFEQPGIDELLNYEMPSLIPGDEPAAQSSPKPAPKRRMRA